MTRWKCRLCINTAIFHSTAYSCVTRSTGSRSFLWVRVVPASVSRCVHALAIAVPPRHPAGLSSCRGLCRGGISTRLQSERSYLRSKVPDGVSHLFPCTAGALFPEANNLLLPLPVTPARAFFTMGAAHSSLRAQASSSFRSQERSS